MARIATQLMLGKKLRETGVKHGHIPHCGVKEAVFPFPMFPEVNPVLGPEMRSTGEVLGMSGTFGLAFYKAQEAAKQKLPTDGTVLISVNRNDHAAVLDTAIRFRKLGFRIKATEGTHAFLFSHGVEAEPIKKLHGVLPVGMRSGGARCFPRAG
jgi:carbamoyl-phosphate synthase large subunit